MRGARACRPASRLAHSAVRMKGSKRSTTSPGAAAAEAAPGAAAAASASPAAAVSVSASAAATSSASAAAWLMYAQVPPLARPGACA